MAGSTDRVLVVTKKLTLCIVTEPMRDALLSIFLYVYPVLLRLITC